MLGAMRLAQATFCLAVALSCHSEEATPGSDLLSGGNSEQSQGQGGGLLQVADASYCGLGVSELEIQRPNLYFVLDASGSMLRPMGGTPDNRHEAALNAVRNVMRAVGTLTRVGAANFPGARVGDLSTQCDVGEEVYQLRTINEDPFATTGFDGFDTIALMDQLSRRDPAGGTPITATLRLLEPQLLAMEGPSAVFLLTDGGPNCSEFVTCNRENCIPNIERTQLDNGVLCDDSVNCCDPDKLGSLHCLDEGSRPILERLRDAGVATYVIGLPGTEIYARVLNVMAVAGGAPQDGETSYYAVPDTEALSNTLIDLAKTAVLRCDFDLRQPPDDPALVNVLFDGEPIPFDADDSGDGWIYSSGQTLTVVGRYCQDLKDLTVTRVRIQEGCPSIVN